MTQTNNRILDDLAKLMTDAAGAAQGVKREVEGVVRSQAERSWPTWTSSGARSSRRSRRWLRRRARENERLAARIAELEAAPRRPPGCRRGL